MQQDKQQKIVLAIPKGRIYQELEPILQACDIIPEQDFFDKNSRKLLFSTNHNSLDIIRVRAFDVACFVAQGAAQIGVVGNDVIEEFRYSELYAPLDLNIGHCHMSVAMHKDMAAEEDPTQWSHIRVVTKYPHLTSRYFAERGVQAECIKLNGAMEIAPALGMARRIVDLVSSGATLKANDLVEVEKIIDITSHLIVNRTAQKTYPAQVNHWIEKFQNALR